MKARNKSARMNMHFATVVWGRLPNIARHGLNELTSRYALSVVLGDVQYIDRRWYITHAGLLRLSSSHRCDGIRVVPVRQWCDSASSRWVFKATVYKTANSRGFVGYGDADPSNVSSLVHGAEMRVAETRAVNRAFVKPTASAYARSRNSVGRPGEFLDRAKPDAIGLAEGAVDGAGFGDAHFCAVDQG